MALKAVCFPGYDYIRQVLIFNLLYKLFRQQSCLN
jgi:hypothetical protein